MSVSQHFIAMIYMSFVLFIVKRVVGQLLNVTLSSGTSNFFYVKMKTNCQTHTRFLNQNARPHPCGVSSLRVVLQNAGEAKIRHFAHKVTVDQDVASCQIAVDIAHVSQVPVFISEKESTGF